MSVTDRANLAALFGAAPPPPGETPSFAEQRTRMEQMVAFLPATADRYEDTPATVGGIKGEWVRARGAREDAAILYLHGGGYCIGSPKTHRHLVGALSVESGLSAFVPDYRMGPENPFPAAVEDAVAAYKGLLDSGIAATHLAIAGDSAGGGLTFATLLALRDAKIALPACAVGISPWVDLTASGDSMDTRAARDPIVQRAGLTAMAAAYLGGADAKTPYASPLFGDLSGLPPILLQVGTEETLYDDTTRLKGRLEEAGVEVTAESWGGMIHVWHAFHPILSEGRDAVVRASAFIKRRIP
jgi:acetyl esterase/lipase